jgi:hypothetical protein
VLASNYFKAHDVVQVSCVMCGEWEAPPIPLSTHLRAQALVFMDEVAVKDGSELVAFFRTLAPSLLKMPPFVMQLKVAASRDSNDDDAAAADAAADDGRSFPRSKWASIGTSDRTSDRTKRAKR